VVVLALLLATLVWTLLAMITPASAGDVLVFAASSLTDALEEIGRAYAAETGEQLRFNFGASSDLARQIVAGAPADVFFSADVARMDAVEHAGRVSPAERRNVLANALAVVVPRSSSATFASVRDLLTVERLALADPETVPAGIYARRWLETAGVWPALRARVVPTLDVRAALAAVAGAHADAGIVYRTDATIEPRVRTVLLVPRSEGPAIVYVIAPLIAAKAAGARRAAAFLAGATARAVYERRGFIVLSD
jgi:molybdate transport system substrate-binding protein